MGLFANLLNGGGRRDNPELAAAIERAIERVEPRLRQAGGYPERYRKPVAHGLEYARALADRLPGPLAVNRQAYASDPMVHALFSAPDEVHKALCLSQAMREYRQQYPAATAVYALMCMRRGTKAVLGIEMDGEVLRRDVPQQAVYFTDHTLADPGVTEAEARTRIAAGFFDSLLAHVAFRIDARKQQRSALEQARDECLAKLHSADEDHRTSLTAQLDGILRQLAVLTESLALHRYLDDFEAVLLAPEQVLFVERKVMALDSMGLMREPDSAGARALEFCDLTGRDRRHWTVVLMYCDQVAEESSLGDRLESAQRWLGL